MTITSLGDLAQSFILRRHGAEAKAQMRALSVEMTTGYVTDAAKHLSGDLSALSGIEASLSRLDGFKTVTTELSMTAGVIQSALSTMDDLAGSLSSDLLAAASSFSEDRVVTVAHSANQQLEAVMGALNTRFGDRSVFSGVAVNQPAVVSASDLLDMLQTVTASAISAADAEQLVSDWFDDPSGFAAQAYLGSGAQQPLVIAPGQTAQVNVTALDPAILDTLKHLALPALMTRGLFSGSPTIMADVAKRAGEGILETASGRARLAARIGSVEAAVGAAETRNSGEFTALGIARVELLGIDEYETATRLGAAQTQLETLYAVTARMQQFSLVNYL